MSEPASDNWTILGANAVADTLRAAAPFRPAPQPLTIACEPGDVPADAFALGPAALDASNERAVPWHLAFEAVEEMERALRAGEVGQIYGCFGSYRLPRDTSVALLTHDALLPLLATTLHLLDRDVIRVWAQRASLLQPNDAWFVTAALADETLVTLEALIVTDIAAGPELLIEVTGADRVLRAEPLRQAVIVERTGGAPAVYPWWEDVAERYLAAVIRAAGAPATRSGSRLRSVWHAIERSVASGAPVWPA